MLMNLETLRLMLQSQKYNSHIFGMIARWAKCMDVQMKSFIFKPANLISILTLLHIFKTARDCNGNDKRAAMWLFLHFIDQSAKATLSYRICATDKTPRTRKKLPQPTATLWTIYWKPMPITMSLQKPRLISQSTKGPKIYAPLDTPRLSRKKG